MAFLLQHLLSESATKYPDRDAIVFKDRSISYNKLERASNKLAHALLTLNIVKGDRIGIYLDRGIESIIAVFGILKSGAVYVPIDPMSPVRRIDYIIKKCGIKILITKQDKLTKIEQAFPDSSPIRDIVLMDQIDPDREPILGTSRLSYGFCLPDKVGESTPSVKIIASDIAYILFTSGSTGNPKGVMISHLNSLTFINSTFDFFAITKDDRVSNIAPLHFDMSVFDIFVAIKAGACVVIIPETIAIFPFKLAEYISKNKISVWNSVPSALSLLATLKNLETFDFSSLRLILFAGELFPLKYLRLLKEAIPGARFCNMYGQTEANSSTYYWVDRVPSDENGLLPIGNALPNFEVFAIDENGKCIHDPGQEGELFVRATTVALGYFDEPEKSEKAFVKNPLHPEFPEKVYKTGDIVRLDTDGNYVFIGRQDHMIKSRGYRIEIGEIETVLCSHPEIKNAVVVPIFDELIGNKISVIIVPFSPGKITKDDIFRYCFTHLPKYMVPEIIEFRDSLPTTSSGKVDRFKLKGL